MTVAYKIETAETTPDFGGTPDPFSRVEFGASTPLEFSIFEFYQLR